MAALVFVVVFTVRGRRHIALQIGAQCSCANSVVLLEHNILQMGWQWEVGQSCCSGRKALFRLEQEGFPSMSKYNGGKCRKLMTEVNSCPSSEGGNKQHRFGVVVCGVPSPGTNCSSSVPVVSIFLLEDKKL